MEGTALSTPWKIEPAFNAPIGLVTTEVRVGTPPPASNCDDSAPSAVVESKPMASGGWSKKIPYPARITVLPSPLGSHARAIRGDQLFLSRGIPSSTPNAGSAAVFNAVAGLNRGLNSTSYRKP